MKSHVFRLATYVHAVIFLALLFIILPLTCSLLPGPAYAADVTLAWDANTEPDLAGYKVYYKRSSSGPPYDGTEAREGESPIDVGEVTQVTLHDLTENVVYFIALTAYDTEGRESGYSQEVSTGDDDDPDGDGLNNTEENIYGTDPNNADTDQDGLPDGWEVAYGLDPLDDSGEHGTEGDPDQDGWCNYDEYLGGTDPVDIVSYPGSSLPQNNISSSSALSEPISVTPLEKAGCFIGSAVRDTSSHALPSYGEGYGLPRTVYLVLYTSLLSFLIFLAAKEIGGTTRRKRQGHFDPAFRK
ncbi:MAG: fibronectin type III domain-containing protein [Thermodesulfobacteriota bacterium]